MTLVVLLLKLYLACNNKLQNTILKESSLQNLINVVGKRTLSSNCDLGHKTVAEVWLSTKEDHCGSFYRKFMEVTSFIHG